MPKILIVDDERAIRRTLREILEYEKYEIEEAEDGEIGLDKIEKNSYDVVILDIKMPKKDGIEVLTEMKQKGIDTPVIMLSGHGNLETAVEAVKKGAFDYIPKPPDLNRLLITLRNAMEKVSLVTETKILKKKIAKSKQIVGDSTPIQKIKETIAKVAPTEARVLITGDNGSGKELVARWLHEQSNRANGPLVEVNCAAIPSELIESELFGHEKGAFTSAVKQRIGKFEQANGGTLFLDEIGDMSLSAQAKVLRALQENKITKVGGDKEEKVDVRVIAATNKDLLKEVEENRFRLDLYHRLSVILIHVPSLNQRKDDIPSLTEHFLDEICGDYGIPVKKIEQDAIEALQARNWTGNIRELRNVVERLVIMSDKTITKQDVIDYSGPGGKAESKGIDFDKFANLQQLQDYVERSFIEYKLDNNSWNTSKTADDIGVSRKQLEEKMEGLGLKKR
ncbi:MAG TPA: sigma-54 dependent transcriptional regulator [Chitinophagales bacterium]|nr:sigma-54 dependent transcriptional regulator [Chitinophagales bacterium]HQD12791.1 sigma-54 dependent transcriptional regulator [Chitinophagales bacterium]HQO30815.1 sigma-54 dependent transcriptional regulator [Chitinophagales bacterium]HQO88969.1 sigma-54 dependent transcriptional regulator [Chitinophagales bacterium]